MFNALRPVDQQTINQFVMENCRSPFQSRFRFVMDHKGFRPNALHGIMGTTGCGKSTIAKAMVADLLDAGKNVLVWLSEENPIAYQVKIQSALKNKENIECLSFFEEPSITKQLGKDHDKFLKFFEQFLIINKPDFVVIDNITTGEFYSDEAGVSGQADSADLLKRLPPLIGAPILWIGHTGKHVRDSQPIPICPEDIRGNRKIVNITEYLYVVQKYITLDGKTAVTTRCLKHRNHDFMMANRYWLVYENGIHKGDFILTGRDYEQLLKETRKARE